MVASLTALMVSAEPFALMRAIQSPVNDRAEYCAAVEVSASSSQRARCAVEHVETVPCARTG